MKTLTLFTLLLAFSISSYSQIYVEGVNINETDVEYCLLTYSKTGSFYIDYGQDKAKKNGSVTDSNGNDKSIVRSTVALNLFAKNGWEVVSHNTLLVPYSGNVCTYLLRRKKD